MLQRAAHRIGRLVRGGGRRGCRSNHWGDIGRAHVAAPRRAASSSSGCPCTAEDAADDGHADADWNDNGDKNHRDDNADDCSCYGTRADRDETLYSTHKHTCALSSTDTSDHLTAIPARKLYSFISLYYYTYD